MVRPAASTPEWAASLPRAQYLRCIAAMQRWLTDHGPGMVLRGELRVHGGAIALAPLAEACAGVDLAAVEGVVIAFLDAAAREQATAARRTSSDVVGSGPVPLAPQGPELATSEVDASTLRVRLAAASSAQGLARAEVGIPGLVAVLAREVGGALDDITLAEASAWRVDVEALVGEVAQAQAERAPDSVRVCNLPLIGEFVAVEGTLATTSAHAMWPERHVPGAREFLVGIPDEHLVVIKAYDTTVTEASVRAFSDMCADEFRSGLGGITPTLFRFRVNGVEIADLAGRSADPSVFAAG